MEIPRDEIQVEVTKHAEQRVRERLGLPRRAVRRMAAKVWHEGVDCACSIAEYEPGDTGAFRLVGSYVWVFCCKPGRVVLITVHPTSRVELKEKFMRLQRAHARRVDTHCRRAGP